MHGTDLSSTGATPYVETPRPEDEDAIFALCRLCHAENGIFAMAEHKVRAMIRRATARDRAIMGLVRHEGQIVGCICIIVDQMWYTDDEDLTELFNFVHPEFRRFGYAQALVEFAKSCSDQMRDLRLPLFIGIISNRRTAAKVRLYRRSLGEPAGAFFIHNRDVIEHAGKPA